MVLSCLAGTYLWVKRAERQGIPPQQSLNALLIVFVCAIGGARLYYLVQHYDFFTSRPVEIFAMWKGGLVSYGGFLGGALGGIWYLKKARISIWKFADCAAPSIALGIFLTRLGCFMNGCCFGKVSDLPWAVRFPPESGPYFQQFYHGQISGIEPLSLPVHPTQIYHALSGLVLFFLLMSSRGRRIAEGQLFLGFAFLYSITRFGIEFYRADVSRGLAGNLSLPQIFALFMAAGACGLLFFRHSFRPGANR